MAITLASQAKDVGSIPIARSRLHLSLIPEGDLRATGATARNATKKA